MDSRCHICDTLYHLSPAHAGLEYRCFLCSAPLTVPASAPRDGSATMYLVCAFCREGFNVASEETGAGLRCPHCGRAIDLGHENETIVVDQSPHEWVATNKEETHRSTAPADEKVANSEGRMLGGYRLQSLIGHTPLGNIFQGEQVALKRKVAIHLLDRELSEDDQCIEAFLDVSRQAAGLVHPHIARVYDVDTDGKHHYMVSELVKGDSLDAMIVAGRLLDYATLARVGAQAARALALAHESKIIHGGLSPANIIIDTRGDVRLLHFGIGRTLLVGAGLKRLQKLRDERCFLPPELLARSGLTEKSDLYSLGVTLYAAVTGSYPYSISELEQVVRDCNDIRPPHMAEVAPDIPNTLSTIVEAMIRLKPAERPVSAAELAVQLESFSSGMEGSADSPDASGVRLAQPAKRRYRRFPAEMGVRLGSVDVDRKTKKEYLARLGNLSENGAFVMTNELQDTGSFVSLEFTLEGSGAQVQVLGLVRWVDSSPGSVGMGVQFLEVSTQDRGNLNRYVDQQGAADILHKLISSSLHKAILKFLCRNWGEVVTPEEMMKGTGASRSLFDRTFKDFEEVGLLKATGRDIQCVMPESDALANAIDNWMRSSRR